MELLRSGTVTQHCQLCLQGLVVPSPPALGSLLVGLGVLGRRRLLHAQLTHASPSIQFQSNAALFEAVELQDLDRVQELLKQYSPEELDLNTPNSEGLLPLDIAIMTNNAPIARALLQAGAKESPHCELPGDRQKQWDGVWLWAAWEDSSPSWGCVCGGQGWAVLHPSAPAWAAEPVFHAAPAMEQLGMVLAPHFRAGNQLVMVLWGQGAQVRAWGGPGEQHHPGARRCHPDRPSGLGFGASTEVLLPEVLLLTALSSPPFHPCCPPCGRAVVSLESRSLHLSTLVREAEQRVNELTAQVVNEAPNADCSEKEKQLKAWEWRFRLYKRMKAGFEHARESCRRAEEGVGPCGGQRGGVGLHWLAMHEGMCPWVDGGPQQDAVGFEAATLTVVTPCTLFPQECQTLLLMSTFQWPAAPRCR